MAENKPLLRILCIHGYRQSAQAFRERTGAFRKIIKKYAELVFISAPNVVPPLPGSDEPEAGQSDQRGWWFSRGEDDYFDAHNDSECIKGYQQSLEVIEEAFREQGPFDGVLGFSQGASMVSLLCGLRETDTAAAARFPFHFAVLVAGFKSRSRGHDALYSVPVTMPTLHVYGETDKVIEKEMSENLLQYFKDPQILSHPGGHFIPAASAQKQTYLSFLDAMRCKYK